MIIPKDYGHFGTNSAEYNLARTAFPDEVFCLLWKQFGTNNPRILDVGCGTGIATRQLAQRGAKVIGADIDALMIEEAKKTSVSEIAYLTAPTESLPFLDTSFEAVTAFSSFHWFANGVAVSEIARILVPQGSFLAVNKDDTSKFRVGYRACIAKFARGELPDIKEKYFPAKMFLDAGFNTVTESSIDVCEQYTLDGMLRYLHSVSLWNLVPSELKGAASEALRDYCSQHLVDGLIERKITIRVTLGRRN